MGRHGVTLCHLNVGDVVEGVVTGVIDFGAFMNVDGIEGLITSQKLAGERGTTPRTTLKLATRLKPRLSP